MRDFARYGHTARMQLALTTADMAAARMCRELFDMALELNDSIVRLPHEENGAPVKVGAIKDVIAVRDYLVSAASALSWMMDRDEYDLIRYEHRFVNNKFVFEQEMKEHFSHITREIVRLKTKLLEKPA
jgi:hypothetical protein